MKIKTPPNDTYTHVYIHTYINCIFKTNIHIYFQMDIESEWIVKNAKSLRTDTVSVKTGWVCW